MFVCPVPHPRKTARATGSRTSPSLRVSGASGRQRHRHRRGTSASAPSMENSMTKALWLEEDGAIFGATSVWSLMTSEQRHQSHLFARHGFWRVAPGTISGDIYLIPVQIGENTRRLSSIVIQKDGVTLVRGEVTVLCEYPAAQTSSPDDKSFGPSSQSLTRTLGHWMN